jgi:hypothetical protein
MKSSIAVLALLVQHGVDAVRNIRIVSPLQSLTIVDAETREKARQQPSTPRARFLPKYKAGLEAETRTRQALAEKRKDQLKEVDATSPAWYKDASAAERRSRTIEERMAEEAFDRAVAPFISEEKLIEKAAGRKKGFQFVGVVHSSGAGGKPPITWYARKKPSNSNWSVRLVHVNRDAIIKDLFDQGKIDIFARYGNTGRLNEATGLPVIRSDYSVRERSWK